MTQENIILTGFMGCGKTTVGKLLALDLTYDFVDTDRLIEARAGLTIPEIFSTLGEQFFRSKEREITRELSLKKGQVISTGGGLILDSENRRNLTRSGTVVCLVATPAEILKRISDSGETTRPLLQTSNPLERIIELIEQRKKSYQRFHQIDTTNRTPQEITVLIKELLPL